MLLTDEYIKQLSDIQKTIDETKTALNLEQLNQTLADYKAEMEAPGFWENVSYANKVNQKIKPIEDKIKSMASLSAKADDAAVLIDLAKEENDESLAEEIESELKALATIAEETKLKALLKGDYDANSAILSLHAGAGGTEAQDWVAMLHRMYTRYSERKGYSIKTLDILVGDEAGIKSVTFLVEGLNAYGYLKAEKGVHRLVRISPFDSSSRRHTSFASLDVMPEILDDDDDIVINPDELRIDTYRSSGAGGQHVNKTDSAVRLTHLPTGIVTSCQSERSQTQNKETAMKMMKARLAEKREEEKMAEINQLKGDMKKIEWGSQIRSYVFQPYTLVKDHRTNAENGNITAVMDGDIDLFINTYLAKS
ncbi:MAG: peptide chain release factor 2 [Eubacteriales bacterium]